MREATAYNTNKSAGRGGVPVYPKQAASSFHRLAPALTKATKMKAIETKFVGPGNVRGSRYIASDSDGNRVILSADYELNHDGNHRKAAEALRDKMGWKGQLVGGSLKKTDVWVFSDVTEAAIAAYRYADFSSCPEVAQMLKDAFNREGISLETTEGKAAA